MKAIFNEKIIAESDDTVFLEGNHYFPKDSVNMEFLMPSSERYTCPWKGEAKYYNIEVNNEVIEAGAWEYPEPKEAAMEIKGRVAFWRGVIISE